MAEPYIFPGERPLFDITVTQVKPGATHTTVTTGQSAASDSTGQSQMTQIGTQIPVQSAALSGLFADVTRIFVVSPVDASGTAPDVTIWPYIDGVDLSDHLVWDGSQAGNMLPVPGTLVDGGGELVIGIPFRQLMADWAKQAQAALNKGQEPHGVNIVNKATGLKARRSIQFKIQSNAGWGNSGTAQVPLRILGYGDALNGAALDQVAELVGTYGYPGSVSRNVQPFTSLSVEHQLTGGLSASAWSQLPGGTSQTGPRIWRFLRFAYNAVATSPSNQFVLSNKNSVQGVQGNVQSDQDIGFDYQEEAKYLEITNYGVRAGTNNALAGWTVNTTTLPTSTGFAATAAVNPYPYGNAQPIRAGSGLYLPLKRVAMPIVANQNKVAFWVQADGTATPANDTSVALAGLQIETGPAA